MFPQMVRFFRVRPRLRPELYCGAPVAGPDAPQPHGSGLRPVPQPFSGRFPTGSFRKGLLHRREDSGQAMTPVCGEPPQGGNPHTLTEQKEHRGMSRGLVTHPGTGCVVEFMQGNAPQIAWVLEEQGGRLRLLLPNRRETNLQSSRLLPWSGPQYATGSRDVMIATLQERAARRASLPQSSTPWNGGIWPTAKSPGQTPAGLPI